MGKKRRYNCWTRKKVRTSQQNVEDKVCESREKGTEPTIPIDEEFEQKPPVIKKAIKCDQNPDLRKLHKCISCHYQTRSKSSIAAHRRRHRANFPAFSCSDRLPYYTCSKCTFPTTLLVNLVQHTHSKWGQPEEYQDRHYCDKCTFETHSRLVLLKHEQKCISAGYVWSKQKWKDYHKCYQFLVQIKNMNIRWLKCEKCSYMARLVGNMAKHMGEDHPASSKVRWQKCEKCLVNVEQIFHLRQHVLKEHGGNVDELS